MESEKKDTVVIQDIILRDLAVDRDIEKDNVKNMVVRLGIKVADREEDTKNKSYIIKFRLESVEEETDNCILKIEGTYDTIIKINNNKSVDDIAWDDLRESIGQASMPFIRELINNITSRMGQPPIFIPILLEYDDSDK